MGKLESWLRNGILGGLFLVPLIPFIVSSEMFFPFITGKNFAFRILVEILFGLWILLALKNPLYRPTFSWVAVGVGMLLIVMTVADIFAENPFKAFWSNFERMEGLIGLLHLALYFLVLGTVLNTKKLWWWFANTSVVASVIMGWYSILQLSGAIVINQGGARVDGTLGNATYLAVYMLVHIFVTTLLLYLWRGGITMRLWYGLALLLQVTILFYTSTRGAILGLLGGAIVTSIPILISGRSHPQVRKGVAAFLGGIILLVGGFVAIKDTDVIRESAVFSRLSNISLAEGETRFIIWGMAYEGWQERPLLGWGHEGFNYVFNKHYNPSLYGDEPWFDRAHNVFFDWLIAGGALGLLAYLSLFLAVLYYIWRRQNHVYFGAIERSILTGFLAAYMFNNLFVFDNLVSSIFFFSFLAYVYSQTRKGIPEHSVWSRPIGIAMIRVAVPFILLCVGSGFYFLNGPGIATATTIINALDTRESPTLGERLERFEQAISYQSVGSQEAAEQANQLALVVRNSDASIEDKQKIFAIADRALQTELERAPSDARLHLFLGSLYDQYGLSQKAEEVYKRALTLSPQKQAIAFQLGINLLSQEKITESVSVFEDAFSSDTSFKEARVYYAATLIYAGRLTDARALLSMYEDRQVIASTNHHNNLLLRAWIQVREYNEAEKILRARTILEPSNAAAQLALAGVLLEQGRRNEAIDSIEAAIAIQPEIETEGRRYIELINSGREIPELGL